MNISKISITFLPFSLLYKCKRNQISAFLTSPSVAGLFLLCGCLSEAVKGGSMNIAKYSLRLVKEENFEIIGKGDNTEKIYQICCKMNITTSPEEHVYVFMLSGTLEIIGVSEVGHGGISKCFVEVGNIFKRALLCNASSIILVHNHPSGGINPSEDDIDLTFVVQDVGEVLGILKKSQLFLIYITLKNAKRIWKY